MWDHLSGRGKVVWLPTFDAAHHLQIFGEPGDGIRVAIDGTVTPEMEAVLRIIARENLVLQTGHVSPAEALAVMRRGRDLGVRNMVVTHAMADVPGMTLGDMRQVAALGGKIELDLLNHLMGPNAVHGWMRHWQHLSFTVMADAIKAIGAEHFVLASDLGQSGNPIHPDGYKMLVKGLAAEGIDEATLRLMMAETPARLLGLD